jgi:hypothetical protein
VSFYNRALTSAEIQSIYNADGTGKCPLGVAPSIITQPANLAVKAGATAAFTVTAAGTPPLSYQWQFNGTNVAGATGTALTLSNVQSAQAGSYTVRVTNTFGSIMSSNAVLTVNQAPPCATPPAGLVSWWRAEGNALDQAGTNNGTLVGNTTYGAGRVGQAFVFDGSGDAVSVGTPTNLQLQNFTIEAWVKRSSTTRGSQDSSGSGAIYNCTWGGYCFNVCDDGRLALGKIGYSAVYSTRTITDTNNFHHITVTKNGSVVAFYVDGNGETAAAYDPGFEFNGPSAIGGRGSDYRTSFLGSIDEVSIYNRALAAAEIQAIYNADGAGKCTALTAPFITSQPTNQTVTAGGTATFTVAADGTPPLNYQWRWNGTNLAGATGTALTLSNVQSAQAGSYAVRVTNTFGSVLSSNAVLTVNSTPSCSPPPSGLVSWWRAEGNGNDAAGTNTATLQGGLSFTNGRVGHCFQFNGVDASLRVPASSTLNVGAGGGLTIECWIDPVSVSAQMPIVEWNSGTFGVMFWVAVPTLYGGGGPGSLYAGLFDTASGSHSLATPGGTLSANRYQHVAMTYDKSSGAAALYLNGVVAAQANLGVFTPGTTADLNIGFRPYGGAAGTRFQGQMDEISLYSRALSASEIQAIYIAGSAGKCPLGVAPSIITQPAGLAVNAGATAAFSVTAAGTTPLSYQWRYNGTNIAGATGTALTLSNVQSAQAGSYAMRVTNTFGSVVSSNALLTVISSPPCATRPAGLVSWWRAEGSANDGVASNNGTLLNGASFASGMVGQAFSFNGSNQCVQVPHAASLVASNYSIEAWVKPLAQVSDAINQDLIFGQIFGRCQLVVRTGSLGVRLAFAFGTSQNSFYEATGTSEIPIGQFSHLAGTWDGTTLRLYINGVLNAQSTPHASPVDSGCPFSIGGFYSPTADSCGYVGQFFNGLIDEASYYSRALSGAEIQSIYNAGGVGKCPQGRQVLHLRLQVGLNPDGTTRVQFVGNNSQSYRIEVSVDMVKWGLLGTCTADDQGNVEFSDPNVAKQPLRFYRAVEQ